MINVENIKYTNVKEPFWGLPKEQPRLEDKVFQGRLDKTLQAMKKFKLDYILVYADREHYGNFEYLTGFGPRFEEALLVLNKEGKAHILLGNECYSMYKYSRIPAEGILYHTFSLPNQTMGENKELKDILIEIGINNSHKVGVVGWKLMYPVYGSRNILDTPSFIADGLRDMVGDENAIN